MIGTKRVKLATTALACLILQGCGDGGGGTVASTPVPPIAAPPAPPPTGANISLLGPLKSETFVNDAAQGTLTVTSAKPTATAGPATASFVYDASSKTYTMTIGGHSQSFGPSSIDASQTNAQFTTYVINSGGTTDSLALTNPGTSGHFTFQYVGAAFWQSTNLSSASSSNGSLYAVTYGEPTPVSAVPVTGTATYAIDVVGAQTNGATVEPIYGSGLVLANFATGSLAMGGTDQYGSFGGTGTLGSKGSFSGTFNLTNGYGVGLGQMSGRLYGPAAQEIGGTFYSDAPQADGDGSAVGAIVGRTQATIPDTSFASIAGAEFLGADAVVQNGKLATASVGVIRQGTLSLSILAPGVSYTELSNGLPYGDYSGIDSAFVSGSGTRGIVSTYSSVDQYVRSGIYFDKTGSSAIYDLFTFGFATPDAAVPRSGFMGYDTQVEGTVTAGTGSSASNNITELNGGGTIDVNLATGTITSTATLNNYINSPNNTGVIWTGLETLTGTGKLSSTGNAFSGTLSVTGGISYTGSWQGRLYGPAATEIGAVFAATGSDNSSLAGTMTGIYDAAVLDPAATLQTLVQRATFTTADSAYANVPSQGYQEETFTGVTQIVYDPASQTYTITPTAVQYNAGPLNKVNAKFTPADIVAAQSDATFTVYSTPTASGRFLNSGASNPTIQLTYVSFAQVTQQVPTSDTNSAAYPVDHFLIFGLPTPGSGMPTTGSASYAGVLYAKGDLALGTTNDANIGGTGQMTANFGTGAFTTTLALNATPVTGGATRDIGSVAFAGTISGTTFFGQPTLGSGQLSGAFYGPNANEVGASFSVNGTTSGTADYAFHAAGVFVGKKN